MEQSVQRLSLLSAFPTANQETIESIKNPNEEIICAVREALSHCFLPGVYEHDEVEKAEERNPDTEGKMFCTCAKIILIFATRFENKWVLNLLPIQKRKYSFFT